MTKVSPSLIFGGEKGDITGYLSSSISSNMIEGLTFESALEKAYQSPSNLLRDQSSVYGEEGHGYLLEELLNFHVA